MMDRKDINDDTVPPLLARSARKRVPGGVVEVKVKAKAKKKPDVFLEKRGRGRPTKKTPDAIARLCEYISQGYSLDAAAGLSDLSTAVIYQWREKNDKIFIDAVDRARSRGLAKWETLALATATGEPGNAAMISLGLRNRATSINGWSSAETKRVEITGANGGAIEVAQRIDVSTLAPDDRDALRDLLMRSAPRLIESTAVEMSDDGDDDGEEEGDDVAVA